MKVALRRTCTQRLRTRYHLGTPQGAVSWGGDASATDSGACAIWLLARLGHRVALTALFPRVATDSLHCRPAVAPGDRASNPGVLSCLLLWLCQPGLLHSVQEPVVNLLRVGSLEPAHALVRNPGIEFSLFPHFHLPMLNERKKGNPRRGSCPMTLRGH